MASATPATWCGRFAGLEYAAAPAIPVSSTSHEPPPSLRSKPLLVQSPPRKLQSSPRPPSLQSLTPPLQPPPPLPLLQPPPELQRMSGSTRSRAQPCATPDVRHSATPEDPPPLSPVNRDHDLHHSVGRLPVMDKTAMLSMLDTREAADASHRKEPTSVGGRDRLSLEIARKHRRQEGPGWCRVCSRRGWPLGRKLTSPWGTRGCPTSLRI